MKRVPGRIGILVCTLLSAYGITAQENNRLPGETNDGKVLRLSIDGAKKFQQIDGFGVNINTRSWDGKKLEPALDLLLDSLHATLWRVIVETVENWEEVNDNADPFIFNWDYYHRLYRTPKFQKAFNTIRYLNQRGITGNLMINFMGRIPLWMGGEIVKPEMEEEYIEMLVSFFYYARFTEHLQFGLISPMNEPDMRKEGPSMGGNQYIRLVRKLMDRMQANGMGDIRYVAPDAASMYKSIEEYLPVLLKDSAVMSKVAHLGLHSYGGYYADIKGFLKRSGSFASGSAAPGSAAPGSTGSPSPGFWVTEWNSWRDGLDDGRIGVYDFPFSSECIYKLLQLIQHGASAGLAYEGYDSYYEHHAPSLFSYWGILGYDSLHKTYAPRKHFYAISQLSRFILPGSQRIGVSQQGSNSEPDNKPNNKPAYGSHLYGGHLTTDDDDSYLKNLPPGEGLRAGDSLIVLAFRDTTEHTLTLVGVNRGTMPVKLENQLTGLPAIHHFDLYYTSSTQNLHKDKEELVTGKIIRTTIPPDCIFTLIGKEEQKEEQKEVQKEVQRKPGTAGERPEPSGWYAGDIHVHRNCGDGTAVFPEEQLSSLMEPNDLAVISLLADNGNGEVKDSRTDLPKVNGRDAAASKPGRIIHWDAEWHWDATYSNFNHEALGGHLVLLGLKEAHQIWDESTYKILELSRQQNAVSGFAHMEYLNDSVQNELNCCIPIDYPVEAALGMIDFISEDVFSRNTANNGTYYSDGSLKAYYRLLNCGFRTGLAAGTDYPCNYLEPPGSLLTYVKVKEGPLTYRKWIDGIKEGRTVISRNGHNEFLDMTVNGRSGPGDELNLKKGDAVDISIRWTDKQPTTGRIELVKDGKVIAVRQGTAIPGSPMVLTVAEKMLKSGWFCARRMDEKGHESHTAAVYVIIDNKPIRTSAVDAQFFVDWIDNMLKNIAPGGKWSSYYTKDAETVRNRYKKARDIYSRIRGEAEQANRVFEQNNRTQQADRTDKKGNSGTPILILGNTANFGLYTGEILKAEGFNEFEIDSLSIGHGGPDLNKLKRSDIVILAETTLTPQEKKILVRYVKEGGNLIAFRPDKSLYSLLGISGTGRPQNKEAGNQIASTRKRNELSDTLSEAYIRADGRSPYARAIVKGITMQALQFHGTADKYTLKGGEKIASVFSNAMSPTVFPAVVMNTNGKGHTTTFCFNLPESIVLTRQGNYRTAGKEMDGITGLRAMDMFTNGWVDTTRNTINQADETMQLLSHCIEAMNRFYKPLPRFWYFPDSLKSLVVLNNDGENSNEAEFDPQFRALDAKGAKMTLYIKDVDKVSKAWVDKWTAKGFEISGHIDDTREAVSPTWAGMQAAIGVKLKELNDRYGIAGMKTVVNHWFVWCGKDADGKPDFVAQARLEANNGMELDANYAHYDNNAVQRHFLGATGIGQGNYTGSGLPLRFAAKDGSVLPIYQLLNNVYDQQYMENRDQEGFYQCFKGLLDRSLDKEVYSFITAKAHNDECYFSDIPVYRMLAYAKEKGIPVWTAADLLGFLKAKDEAGFSDINRKVSSEGRAKLVFRIHSSLTHSSGLTCMIPDVFHTWKIQKITLNGAAINFPVRSIKGNEYAIITIKPGTDYAVEVTY